MFRRALSIMLSISITLIPGPRAARAAVDSQTLGDTISSGRQAGGGGAAASGLESFKADLFTGSASYAIPIAIPPGTAGMQPSLALGYRSNAGNGWVGAGWSLGVPAIARSLRFGTPRYVDDPADPARDRFVLGDDPLVELGGSVYATEIESYARLRRMNPGAPDEWWEVTRRDGRVLRFGDTPDSRLEKSPGRIFAWLLHAEADTHGNGIAYEYDRSTDPGSAYLSRVTYTTHAGEIAMASREVAFVLESQPRPDPLVSYQAGFAQPLTRRLAQIAVTFGGALVRRYELVYDTGASGRSLLRSVRMVGRDGATAAPAQTFTYQTFTTAFEAAIDWPNPSAADNYVAIRPAGPTGNAEYALFDLTGDGLPDRVTRDKTNNLRWKVWTNRGGGAGFAASPILWSNPSAGEVTSNRTIRRLSGSGDVLADVIDLDGDGRSDRVTAGINGDKLNLRFFRNNGTGFAAGVNWPDAANLGLVRKVTTTSTGYWVSADLMDMNGDGKPDRVKANNASSWLVYLGTGAGFAAVPILWSVPAGDSSAMTYDDRGTEADVFDLNGDGLPDRVIAPAGNASAWTVYFGSESGFEVNGTAWPNPSWSITEGDGKKIRDSDNSGNLRVTLADLDGDGLVDRVVSNKVAGTFTVWPNTGLAFTQDAWTWQNPSAAENHPQVIDVENAVTVADLIDLDGDLLPDRLTTRDNKSPWKVYLSNAAPGSGPAAAAKPDLLSRIDNGLGGSITLSYTSSARFIDASGNLLNPALPSPVIVVASSTLHDGRGGESETHYTYAGGSYDGQSREFRGFARVTAAGPAVPSSAGAVRAVSESDFFQDAQRKGLAAATRLFEERDGARRLLSEEIHTYHPDGAAPYERLLASAKSLTWDGAPTFRMSKVELDAYTNGAPAEVRRLGEVTDEAAPFGDGTNDEQVIRSEYAASGEAHLLGLPSHVTVTTGDPQRKLSEQWLYYDGLALGQASRGDRTRVEDWLLDPVNGFEMRVAGSIAYDAFGNPVATTDPNGHVTTTIPDDATHTFPVTTVLPPLRPGVPGFVTTGTFDPALGVPLTGTDLNGHVTRTAYDALGRPVATFFTPDGGGAAEILLGETDYNDALLGTIDDGTGSPGAQHLLSRRFLRAGSQGAIVSRSFFDGLGRPLRTEEPGDSGRTVVRTSAWDAAGRVSAASLPHFAGDAPTFTRSEYDAAGRPVRATNPDGTVLAVTHDGWSRTDELLSSGGESLRKKTTHQDAWGRIVAVEEWNPGDADGNVGPFVTSYGYDPRGNLEQTIDPAGNTTVIAWDTLDRKVAMADPDAGDRFYEYDAGGRLVRQVDAKGRSTTFSYDALDRLNSRTSPDGVTRFTWDAVNGVPIPNGLGRLVRAWTDGLHIDFVYDALGNAVDTTYLNGGKIHPFHRAFDLLGREISATYPDGETVTRVYDGPALKRIESANAPGGAYLAGAEYDALGRPLRLSLGNGAISTWTFNPLTLRPANHEVTASAGAALSLGYAFTPDGNLSAIDDAIDPSRSQAFSYDGLGRLVTARGAYGDQRYRYDALGNLIEKAGMAIDYDAGSGPTGGPHAAKRAGSETFDYDANGNLVRMGARTLEYDTEGRLTAVKEGQALLAGYIYDAFGRRWRHVGGLDFQQSSFGDDYDWNGQQATKYIRAGEFLLAARTAAWTGTYGYGCGATGGAGPSWPGGLGDLAVYGALLASLALLRAASRMRRPVWRLSRAFGVGLLIAAHLVVTTPAARALPMGDDGGVRVGTLFFAGDHLGSTAVVLDEAGSVMRQVHYDPWGGIVSTTGTLDVEQKFTGQRLDARTGLYSYGARDYHPGIGRFIEPDSVVPDPTSSQALNRYAYVYNNPLRYTDPGGNFPFLPILIGALVGGFASHANGGNPITGAILGAVGGFIGPAFSAAFGGGLAGAIAGGAAAGFVTGGVGAALDGGNFLQGAISGAIGSAFLGSAGGLPIDGIGLETLIDPIYTQLARVANGVFRGALKAAGALRHVLDTATFGQFTPAFNRFENLWNYPNNWVAQHLILPRNYPDARYAGKFNGVDFYLTDKLNHAEALTFGRTMFLPAGESIAEKTFEHELGHVAAFNLMGPLTAAAGGALYGASAGPALAVALSHGPKNFLGNFAWAAYGYNPGEQLLVTRGSLFPEHLP